MSTCQVPDLSTTPITFPPYLAIVVKQYLNDDTPRPDQRLAQQQLERYLLSISGCQGQVAATRHEVEFHQLDDVKLSAALNTPESLNAYLHEQITCLITAVLATTDSPDTDLTQRERVTGWFTHLRRIGKSSVESYAMGADISKRNSGIFVIKTPRGLYRDYLLHEAMVGQVALNPLRRLIPNFMYTYGYFTCSPAELYKKEPLTWCNLPIANEISYLVVENVRNSKPIGDLISDPDFTVANLVIVMYQIFNALNVAYKIFDFTHYDLHEGNVLVRRLEQQVTLPYYGTEGTVRRWFVTNYIPYIIDYGNSFITVGGVNLSTPAFKDKVRRSRPMFDVYKIICFVAQHLMTAEIKDEETTLLELRASKMRVLQKMFDFFNERSLTDRVVRRLPDAKDYYSVPRKWKDTTHDTFLKYLEKTIPPPVVKSKPVKGWSFADVQKPSSDCQFYDKYRRRRPLNAVTYCEVVHALPNFSAKEQQIIRKEIASFDPLKAFKTVFLPFIDEKDQEWKRILDTIRKPIVFTRTPDLKEKLGLRTFFDTYRDRVFQLIVIRRDIEFARTELKAYQCSLDDQKIARTVYAADYVIAEKFINKYLSILVTERQVLSDNQQVLDQLFNQGETFKDLWINHKDWVVVV